MASDSGMMGGSVSHEYMLLTARWARTPSRSASDCDYRANMEAAACIAHNRRRPQSAAAADRSTRPTSRPSRTLCAFLHVIPAQRPARPWSTRKSRTDRLCGRLSAGRSGDQRDQADAIIWKRRCHPGGITPESGLCAGFIGPLGLPARTYACCSTHPCRAAGNLRLRRKPRRMRTITGLQHRAGLRRGGIYGRGQGI